MRRLLVAAMPGEVAPAQRLAVLLGASFDEIAVHHFPDGESSVRAPQSESIVALYCSLNDPNSKLIELALAAAALRAQGAERIILVAPYLCYMRQDAAFRVGEAVSQQVVGALLAERFDRIITVEPHLHRTRSLKDVFIGTEATALSASALLAEVIRRDGHLDRAIIIGPDNESRTWTEAIAAQLHAPLTVLQKNRRGDRDVSIGINEGALIAGRIAYLVDDIVSTGGTMSVAAAELLKRGAIRVEAVAVHVLCGADALERMQVSGLARLRSTDSVSHPTNAIEIAPLLARALLEEGL